MKSLNIMVIAFFTALSISFFNNIDGAVDNFRFFTYLDDREARVESVKAAVRQYNRVSASFYNSAGSLAGLNEMPAAPLLKRRFFKDINMLKREGKVMVFDRDHTEVRRIYFINRDLAVAEAEEVWAIAMQDAATRMPLFNLKAVEVKVRYLFHKEQFLQKGKIWVAHEADVYPKDEKVPELNITPFFL
jgi:hypothetical protein